MNAMTNHNFIAYLVITGSVLGTWVLIVLVLWLVGRKYKTPKT